MKVNDDVFRRSIQHQIRLNRSRTPTERMKALCDLLDAARALAPSSSDAVERRRRAQALRQRDREEMRALLAAGRPAAAESV
jgi:hypothetical protein